jgi:hypothetical protein
MQCPSCNAAVREGAKFCGKCGTALPRGCPACGHVNPIDDRFCAECGANPVAGLSGRFGTARLDEDVTHLTASGTTAW